MDMVEKEGHVDITNELFAQFSELVYKASGIRLGAQKRGLLASRLAKRLKVLGMNDFLDYYRRVKKDEEELVEMLNCISTNTTNLFRENHHFDYLRDKILPDLLREKREKTLRIWSAGCSTGEEPYSIAVTIHEALANNGVRLATSIQKNNRAEESHSVSGNDWDIKILATDISTNVLEKAQRGVYELEQLPGDTPPGIIKKYFLKGARENEGQMLVKDMLKDMIAFRRLNLKESVYPFRRTFDVIFCRNVMIYFDENMKRHVLGMFHKHLADEGHLFVGHSEAMINEKKYKPEFITTYKKV